MEPITLQQHNNQWKDIFSREKDLLHNTLGQTIDKIHHVGSTAIPDLISKPIIDIAIESRSFPPSGEIIDKLATIEYEYMGEACVKGRFWFRKGNPRKFNLHFCSINSEIAEKQVMFRDKLIANEHFRRRYEMIKLQNYKDKEIDSADYALAKSDFIEEVISSD